MIGSGIWRKSYPQDCHWVSYARVLMFSVKSTYSLLASIKQMAKMDNAFGLL